MTIRGKGKYIGKRKIEIDQDLDLSPDTEVFYILEEIKPVEKAEDKNEKKSMARNCKACCTSRTL